MFDKPSWLEGVPSKTAFIFGIVSGLGGAALVGLVIMLTLLLGDRGATLVKAGNGQVAQGARQAQPSTPDDQPAGNVEVKVDSKVDHIRGNSKSGLTIVEFSDFQCPFCQRFAPTVQQVLKEYGNKVRFVYKHFPLDSIHPWARPAALASECASEQGKFWEYHDALFARQDEFGTDFWSKLAGELKLNVGKFNDCVSSGKYAARVDADYKQGLSAGVRGTPHTIVGNIPVSGAVPYEQLKAIIDQAFK